MNEIVTPVTPCGNAGIDQFGQLVVYETSGTGRRTMYVIRDPRGKTCTICGRGWELTVPGLKDQYSFNWATAQLVHHRCMLGYHTLREQSLINSVLVNDRWNPGGLGIEVEEVPNEYGMAWNTPWFRIQFTKALPGVSLVIGARKRVWEIRVEGIDHAQMDELVKAFAPTIGTDTRGRMSLSTGRGAWYVHAWSREAVRERVAMMMNVLLPEAFRVVPTEGEGTHAAGSDNHN